MAVLVRLTAGEGQGQNEHLELVGAERIVVDLGDEAGDHVVARIEPAFGGQDSGVFVEFGGRDQRSVGPFVELRI